MNKVQETYECVFQTESLNDSGTGAVRLTYMWLLSSSILNEFGGPCESAPSEMRKEGIYTTGMPFMCSWTKIFSYFTRKKQIGNNVSSCDSDFYSVGTISSPIIVSNTRFPSHQVSAIDIVSLKH